MNNNSNTENNTTEEVDLGQLFTLIGKAFNRFFRFIGTIFHKLFLVFAWLIFFIKKHFLKIAIAGIIGIAFGLITKKVVAPIYKSTIIIKQNYNTGEHLYNTLDYYNSLISEQDSINLASLFKIETREAKKLVGLAVESVLTQNGKLKVFNNYIKGIDTSLTKTLTFEKFLEGFKDYEHEFQKITLKSKIKNNFDKIFTQIIENIASNDFFESEQKKDLEELAYRENIIRESLKESDTLQTVYQEVLKKSVEKVAGGVTSITFEGADDKSRTKEFELYNDDLKLRRELVTIEREKEDLKYIIEIVSKQQTNGTLDNKREVLGFEVGKTILYGIHLALLMVIILLLIDFMKFLERYK